MDHCDVFVWVDGDDGAGASLAVRALRAKFKAPTGDWFVLGARSDRLERLAYDLGAKPLVRPADLGGLGALIAGHGQAPVALVWAAEAVLAADWNPWHGDQVRLWEGGPAVLLRRSDLPGTPALTWTGWQGQSSLFVEPLSAQQVKVLPLKDFEKAAHGSSWPFGPAVVILEKTVSRR